MANSPTELDPKPESQSDLPGDLRDLAEEHRPLSAIQWIGRSVAAIIVLSTFAIWVYAFSGQADRPTPDTFDDPTFAIRAESVCAAALVDIDTVPDALDAESGAERGRQVEATTRRMEQMLDELDALVTGTERDIQITTEWLSNWRSLVQDRYRYASDVTTNPAALFVITDLGINEPLERRLTRLASVNDMPSCSAPGDLG